MGKNRFESATVLAPEGRKAASAEQKERLLRWGTLVKSVRNFFEVKGFVEVDSPILLAAPAQESFIDPIAVTVQKPDGSLQSRYLQPSPELMMKRFLALGLPEIFQIAAVFRDRDDSARHSCEFRMLEWYRRGADFEALMADCQSLIASLVHALGLEKSPQAACLCAPFSKISVEQAFLQYVGFSPLDEGTLAAELRQRQIFFDPQDTPSELFGRVFAGIVEPALLADMGTTPFFLTHYPHYEASLARLSCEDPRVAERFELYVGGIEVANAFSELTDAKEQRERFVAVRREREMRHQRLFPLDEAYLAALERIPSAAGIAMGLERLMMALLGEDTLWGVRPWLADAFEMQL